MGYQSAHHDGLRAAAYGSSFGLAQGHHGPSEAWLSRKSRLPYSENTLLTEYFTRTNESNGDSWLLLTTIVTDPQYLATDFLISSHFEEVDDSK